MNLKPSHLSNVVLRRLGLLLLLVLLLRAVTVAAAAHAAAGGACPDRAPPAVAGSLAPRLLLTALLAATSRPSLALAVLRPGPPRASTAPEVSAEEAARWTATAGTARSALTAVAALVVLGHAAVRSPERTFLTCTTSSLSHS